MKRFMMVLITIATLTAPSFAVVTNDHGDTITTNNYTNAGGSVRIDPISNTNTSRVGDISNNSNANNQNSNKIGDITTASRNTLDNKNTNHSSADNKNTNNSTSKNHNKSNSKGNVTENNVSVDNTSSGNTLPPAPPATAPTVVGSAGTESTSAGISTPFGGISYGKSTTIPEARRLIRTQATAQDIANLKSLDGLNEKDAALIRKQIMRNYK